MGQIVMQFVGNNTSIGSKLIEWFSHSPYSHVDTVMPNGTLLGARSDKIMGVPPGVQIRPASYVLAEHDLITRVVIPCTDAQQKKYYQFVTSQIGKPYDKTAIFAFVVNRDWTEDDAWFCSELNSAGTMACGLFKHLSQPHNKIDPGDLFFLISSIVDIKKG
jgi:uncharacterized protein YycO